MLPENAEPIGGVRTAVSARKKTRRTLDERVLVRFPALVRLLASAWSRLPPRSRVRRAFLSRFLRQACEAANRRDFDVLLLALDPDVEYRIDDLGGLVPPDLHGVHRGHEGYLHVWEEAIDAMEDVAVIRGSDRLR